MQDHTVPEGYLVVKSLVKTFDGRLNAVDHIDLNIAKGEFVSFLGPSGSGKTTTLMMIAGFESPTSGQINLGGENLIGLKPYQRDIGVVFQNYALFPHMTVEENVGFPLRMRKVPSDEHRRRVADAIEMVGLTAHAKKPPSALSGGQQQRVALARGLIFNPRMLLLDEPLGALDKRMREQMQLEIKRIHRELDITMVYVTHDQSEAMTMADRIAVFNKGKIEQIGRPLDIYNSPSTEFVADFIGESNLFKGVLIHPVAGLADIEGLGSVKLQADRTRHLSTGSKSFLIRPEWITFVGDGPDDPDEIELAVEVREIADHGGSCLVIAALNGKQFLVRAPSHRVAHLSIGEPIVLKLNPRWIRVVGS